MTSGIWEKRIKTAKAFTEVYRAQEHDDIALREAACLRAQFPASLGDIQNGDMFAGRLERLFAGHRFGPDTGEMGYLCRWHEFEQAVKRGDIPENLINEGREIVDFWKNRTTMELAGQLDDKYNGDMPEETINALLPPGYGYNWKDISFVAGYMYRFAEINLDFDTLLQNGIDGIKEIITERMSGAENQSVRNFCEALLDITELLRECCLYYARQAEDMINMIKSADPSYINTLRRISQDLRAAASGKPKHLTEAISLFWLYAVLANLDNYGRMDVYLGDFLVRDLDNGYINETQAYEAVTGLFMLINQIHSGWSGRVVIGGMGRRNEKNADRFALIALKAQKNIRAEAPQFSLRCYKGMDKRVYDAALDSIFDGCLYPMLYNDDVSVPCVEKSFRISRGDAEQYIMSNCGEYNIDHKSIATPSGSVNYPKLLELTLNDGIDPYTGKRMLLQTGYFKDYASFDDLWASFEKQVENILDIVTKGMNCIYKAVQTHTHNLFASVLTDGCIDKGTGIIGGAKYCGYIVETHAMITVADSLYAIKKLIYDERKITAERMADALRNNFDGYAAERKLMTDTPKYGNDDGGADEMAMKVISMIQSKTEAMARSLSVDFCLPSHISVDAYVYLGRFVGATPDGRRAGEPVSNSNNPLASADKTGVTALLNSMAKIKPEPSAGQVNHLKLSPSMVKNNRSQIEALIKTFFKNGGNYLCISVLGREELLAAVKEPEKYAYLMVRIGGYSARFVNLPHELQEDIIARMEY